MVNKVIDFTARLTDSQFGKAARQSAERIARVSREAIRTSGSEGRRVFTTVRKEGEKLQKFARVPTMHFDIVDQVQDAAFERIEGFEKAFQKRVEAVLKDLGIPTAKQVAALSRRVEELAAKVDARVRRAPKAPVRARKPAAKPVATTAEAA